MSEAMNESVVHGLALIELVQRLGGDPVESAEEYEALATSLEVRDALRTAAYLAGLVVSIAETTRYPLAAFIAEERADALAPGGDDTPGGDVVD